MSVTKNSQQTQADRKNRSAKRKRVELLHYMDYYRDISDIDDRLLNTLIQIGREDIAETEKEVQTAGSALIENRQLEMPGFRSSRLAALASTAQKLLRALQKLETEAESRALALPSRPRQCLSELLEFYSKPDSELPVI